MWIDAVRALRESRSPGVLVTLTEVRGHAPREAGAKLVVSTAETWGSIGGGNLEESAIRRARSLLADGVMSPVVERIPLTDKAPGEYGVQCCGGEVAVLLEPLAVPPAVAVFGMGHVGFELALVLSRHDLELHLVDSRADRLDAAQLAPVLAGPADVRVHEVPVLPELVIAELPTGCHVLVLTHDHAEDLALLDALLRSDRPAGIGLIGSAAKWARFRTSLAGLGHPVDAIDRVRTPIGDPVGSGIRAKTPAAIAVAVTAEVLRLVEATDVAERP